MPRSKRQASANEHTKKPQNGGKKFGIIAGVIVLAVLLSVTAYGFVLMAGDTIYPNVYVAGVDVGGLNNTAAVAKVEQAVIDSFDSYTLNVELPDRTLELKPEQTKVALDAQGAIDAAMDFGRDRGPFHAIAMMRSAKKNEHSVSLETSLNLDTEYIRKEVEKAAEEAESTLIQPIVEVDEEAETITIVTGSAEVHLDADALYDAILARFAESDFSDLKFDYDTIPCEPIDLEGYYAKYCTEMSDAYYDEEARELVEEKVGYGFDLPYYTQKIAMAKPKTKIIIQMKDLEPAVTLEQLTEQMFGHTLSSYDSPHVVNAPRTNNLDLASKAIDGTILNPGDVFSFNEIVGERTTEKGYQGATVYLDGGVSKPETGGGICQVASAIYECVLYANLKVNERMPHMFVVTYVGYGQDATIYWGQQDFKFTNSTEHPIMVKANVEGGYVHIKLLGTKEELPYESVKISYAVLSETPWKNVGVLNKEAKAEDAFEITIEGEIATDADGNRYTVGEVIETPYAGMSVMTYRHFLDKDGKEISKETIAKSDYIKRDKKYLLTKIEPELPEGEFDENGEYIGDPSVTPGEDNGWLDDSFANPDGPDDFEEDDDPIGFEDPDTW